MTGRLTTTSRQSVDKRTIIENYDLVSLAVDEIVDVVVICLSGELGIADWWCVL